MNALELSRAYFEEILKPRMASGCVEGLGRATVGLFGDGSQCLGFDDEVSRDHDWGVRVCILLNRDDYSRYAERLRNILESAPQEFRDVKTSWDWLGARGGVLETDSWFQGLLEQPKIPSRPLDWLSVEEHKLLSCTNGEVWHDPTGQVTAIRESLSRYPVDIWRLRLSQRCAQVSQSYHNVQRSVSRGEYLAASFAKHYFSMSLMRCWFLLNNEYAPFYKWLHRAFLRLERLPKKSVSLLPKLLLEIGPRDLGDAMETMVTELREAIEPIFPSTGSLTEMWEVAYRVHERIDDPQIRERSDVWDDVPS